MKKKHYPCDLCGQPVKVSGFSSEVSGEEKRFCCEGCLRIFQLLNPEQHSTKPSPEKTS